MIHETTFDLRQLIVAGVIQAVSDAGQAQTVDVKTHDGILRTGIEVQQIFGFASLPPVPGGTAILLGVGGDPGHYVALPLCNPSHRFGGLQAADGGVVYAQDGSRIAVRAGGLVEILGFTKILLSGPDIEIDAPDGVTISGPAIISGNMSITGNLSVGGAINAGGPVTAPAFNLG